MGINESHSPALAIITNGPTPYRTHFHLRIVKEVPELKLLSIFTHEQSNSPWSSKLSAEINPIMLGSGDVATKASLKRDWNKGKQTIDILAKSNVKAVVLYGYSDPGRVRIIVWCAKNKIPCFMWGDSNIKGDLTQGLKGSVKSIVLRKVLSWCTGVMCCGSLGEQYFMKYGVRQKDIFWVPYEPDYDLIQSIPQEKIEDVAKKYNLDPARKRFVYSARMIEVKRPDLLIEAFIQIADQRPDWDLLMLGEGHLKSQLQQKVPEQLKNRVIWTGFLDDQQAVSALYKNCDILILPSDYEPWALVINEAAAAGLGIIASDVVGAAAELVKDGVNGYLFRRGDLGNLIEAMLKSSDDFRLSSIKMSSLAVLLEWRQIADPVLGLKKALYHSRVL